MKTLFIFTAGLVIFSCSPAERKTETNESTEQTEINQATMNTMNFYDFTYSTPSGEEKSMEQYKGKAVLIVNTATKCGLTPQFSGLEELHQNYGEKGLKIIGFPCNQFGGQEPLTNEEMVETCKVNHGVTFELAKKTEVNGENANTLYNYLKSEQTIAGDNEIRWNFEKFLIDKNGKVIARFSPQTTPEELTTEIEKLL